MARLSPVRPEGPAKSYTAVNAIAEGPCCARRSCGSLINNCPIIAEWLKMDDVSALAGAIAVIFGVLMIGMSGAKRWRSHGLLFVVGALLAIAGFGVEVADMLAQRSSAPSADQAQA